MITSFFYETVVFKPSVDKIPLSGHLLTVRFCVLNSFLVYLLWNIWHVTISIRLCKGCVLLSRRKDAFFNELSTRRMSRQKETVRWVKQSWSNSSGEIAILEITLNKKKAIAYGEFAVRGLPQSDHI